MRWYFACAIVCLYVFPSGASESDALAIDANIRARHLPFGTLLDPIYAAPDSDQIVGYTRCGDSALWTGAYLAAEAFRYNVTHSADALSNVRSTFAALKGLSDITGDNRLARCIVLASSPYADGIAHEESANQIVYNQPWFWVDNTSRDQIVGAFFGLGVAYDLVDDTSLKQGISDLVTRLIGYISRHQWSPNDDITTTFRLRPESLQMLLEVARHVNPSIDVSGPFLSLPIETGVAFDVQSNSSYFKFDLDYMSLYHLVRLQDNGDNRGAYQTLRNYTQGHQNAFFNMIDRSLRGADPVRDAETRSMLDQLLTRSRRDFYSDLSTRVAVCGTDACQPIPVQLRTPATFLWEVSPFQLKGGGSGVIESSGVDYLLPYWMGRYYGVIDGGNVVSAASSSVGIAPGGLATVYGQNLSGAVTIGGRTAQVLFASPTQINFAVPDGTAAGNATLAVGSQNFAVTVLPEAPAFFSMNGSGTGVAAATAVITQAANPQLQAPVPVFDCSRNGCVAVPIQLGVDQPIYVSFYGTGIRNRSALANVVVTIAGVSVPVQFAGPAPGFVGLDQVNVLLPLTLRGAGESRVVLAVAGPVSKAVTIQIR
jgi:uncharacterized protein (TIGR03437 family)